MKYKKTELRLKEIASAIQGFYFLVKFGLVLIYILKICVKKSFSIFIEKKYVQFITCFFLLKNMYLFQVLKDFSVENLETAFSSFLSKFFPVIDLFISYWINNIIYIQYIYISNISRFISYWGSIFTLYLTWGAFSLVCVLSVFYSFLSFSFLFLLVFSLTETNDSQDNKTRRGNHYFSCFPLPPLMNIH